MKTFTKISLYVFVALAVCLLLYSVAGIVYALLEHDYSSAAVYGFSAVANIISLTLAVCVYLIDKQ